MPSRQHTDQTGWWASQSLAVKSAAVAVAGVAATSAGLFEQTGTGPGNLDTINDCPMAGNAKPKQWEAYANPLKNRWHFPSGESGQGEGTNENSMNSAVNFQALANALSAPKSGSITGPVKPTGFANGFAPVDFNDSESGEIDGYIAEVKPGGDESCNCNDSADLQYMDTHIYVAPDRATATPANKSKCLIVEVTPRVRVIESQAGQNWQTNPLIASLKQGTHVHIGGWLFDDQEHRPNSAVDTPGAKNAWRVSCWEIHPVTDIQVLNP